MKNKIELASKIYKKLTEKYNGNVTITGNFLPIYEKLYTFFKTTDTAGSKYIKLGKNAFSVPFVGYGCLQLESSGKSDKEQIDFIVNAHKMGVRFFDTAAVYGKDRHNEMIMGNALNEIKKIGGEIPIIATKCGIAFNPESPYLLTPKDIEDSVETSLNKLGVDRIDLLYLHRIDPSLNDKNFNAALLTLKKLILKDKIKHIGLSECNAKQIREANKIVPITSVELAYSLFTRRAELNGVWDTCKELGIGLVAYSSIARGATNTQLQNITDSEVNNLSTTELQVKVFKLLEINDEYSKSVGFFSQEYIRNNIKALLDFQKIASYLDVSPSQLALAWLGHRGVVSIPGTTNVKHLEENIKAMNIEISGNTFDSLTEKFYPGRFKGNPNPNLLDFLDDLTLEETNLASSINENGTVKLNN